MHYTYQLQSVNQSFIGLINKSTSKTCRKKFTRAKGWVVSGDIPRWFTRPHTVTHPSTNRARRRVTKLIEANQRATTKRQANTLTLYVTHYDCQRIMVWVIWFSSLHTTVINAQID